MTFLPIVGRELRVAARRRGTWWARLGAALVALVIGGWVMLFPDLRRPGVIGQAIFIPLSVFTFLYSLLAGIWTTADTLSEEKREGTMGLLFLTDLKGYDVVLGKLAASSLHVLYGLLAVFPVMAIPLLAGGVSINEFVRVVVVSLNNLFFSLSAGMLCSAVSRDERKAMTAAFGIVLVFTVLLPVGALIHSEFGSARAGQEFMYWLLAPSPGCGAYLAFDVVRMWAKGAGDLFRASVACVFTLSAMMLGAACLIAPRTWQERAATAGEKGWGRLRRNWTFGGPAGRRLFRTRMLEHNPFYWLAARERNKPLLVWFFLLGVAGIWLAFLLDWRTVQPNPIHWLDLEKLNPRGLASLFFGLAGLLWKWRPIGLHREYLDGSLYVMTALLAHTILKSWVASEAARRVCADRRSGALELVLCTPLGVRRIIGGQILALERQFALPVLVVLVADLFFLLSESTDRVWVTMWVCGMVALVVDLAALAVLGMWHGLRGRNTSRAAAAAVVRVMVLPWVLLAMVMSLVAVVAFTTGSGGPRWFEEWMVPIVWLVISLGVCGLFAIPAWARLQAGFREAAGQRYDARRRWGVGAAKAGGTTAG